MENESGNESEGRIVEESTMNTMPVSAGTGRNSDSEMESKSDELLKVMKKQLLASRINACMLAGILITALVFGLIIGPGLIRTLSLASKSLSMVNSSVIPMIEQVNVDNLNGAVGELKDAVSEFDVDSMNSTVRDLQSAVEGIDIKSLNEAIQALNATLQPLAKFFGGGN